MTNIKNLPALSGDGTEFVITTNSDWYDSIFFPAIGSPAETTLVGSMVAGSNQLTVSSTLGLAVGMPIVPSPGVPSDAFIDTISSSTTVTMINGDSFVVYATATDNNVQITFQQVPMDLTGIEFVANLRSSVGDPNSFLTAQTSDNTLINGERRGVLAFDISAELDAIPSMANIPPGDYVIDIVAVADGAIINLFPEGPAKVTVLDGVTDPTT